MFFFKLFFKEKSFVIKDDFLEMKNFYDNLIKIKKNIHYFNIELVMIKVYGIEKYKQFKSQIE